MVPSEVLNPPLGVRETAESMERDIFDVMGPPLARVYRSTCPRDPQQKGDAYQETCRRAKIPVELVSRVKESVDIIVSLSRDRETSRCSGTFY